MCSKLSGSVTVTVPFCSHEKKTIHQNAVVICLVSDVRCCCRNAVPTLLGRFTGTARNPQALRSRHRRAEGS
jgi:hypothetical protein